MPFQGARPGGRNPRALSRSAGLLWGGLSGRDLGVKRFVKACNRGEKIRFGCGSAALCSSGLRFNPGPASPVRASPRSRLLVGLGFHRNLQMSDRFLAVFVGALNPDHVMARLGEAMLGHGVTILGVLLDIAI